MTFDPCPHHIAKILIKAGQEFRKLGGLPEEANVSILYQEAAEVLKVSASQFRSSEVDHLPSPAEMKDESGKLIIPRMPCPRCKKEEAMTLVPICRACKDSEMGKYRTAWRCTECGYMDRSQKVLIQWLKELGVEVPDGTKQSLGIVTLTDDGLK